MAQQNDGLFHAANALACLGAIATDTLATAGLGTAALLSIRELRKTLPSHAQPLIASIAKDLASAMDAQNSRYTPDQKALLPQMIVAASPTPEMTMAGGRDAPRIAAAMLESLTDYEHRLPDNTAAFTRLVTPILARLLSDPAYTAQLEPAFQAAMLDMKAIIARIDTKIDDLGAALGNLSKASHDLMETLATRFRIPDPFDLGDAALREELEKKAADYRRLLKEVEGLKGLSGRVDNIYAAALGAIQQGRFEDARQLLRDAREIHRQDMLLPALITNAKLMEAEADLDLLEGRVEDACTILCAAADSFASVDLTQSNERRILRYFKKLADHGSRHVGTGLLRAVDLARPALTNELRAKDLWLWAAGQKNTAGALQEEGRRSGRTDLLIEAVSASGLAKKAFDKRGDIRSMADSHNTLAISFQELGVLSSGHEGIGYLCKAVSNYDAAHFVYDEAFNPEDWAMVSNNIGNAFRTLGSRIPGSPGLALLGRSEAALQGALRVRRTRNRTELEARTLGGLAYLELTRAQHDTTLNPRPHLLAALAHVEAALQIFDPVKMSYNHAKATELRDDLIARINALPD